jgi:hypothetical protein
MEVLYLTIFLSFTLAVFFLMLYVRGLRIESKSSPEQTALIPFRDDETSQSKHLQETHKPNP